MLRFFRQIRQRLLTDNKFSKYLLYAIGEILLVVIGIVLALQVDNWNQKRQREEEVAKYLINLRDALQDDVSSLDNTISTNQFRLYGIFYILKFSELNTATFADIQWTNYKQNTGPVTIWEGPFPDTINRPFSIKAFNWLGRGFGGASFNKSVINELYATGSFSDIRNPLVKEKISAYYRYLEQRMEGYAIEEHEEWANEVTRFFRDQYGIFTLDISDMEEPFALLKGKKDVEQHLRYLALEVNYHCIWSERARTLARELIDLINQELEN
jgi:hypothetical protein